MGDGNIRPERRGTRISRLDGNIFAESVYVPDKTLFSASDVSW